MAVVINWVEPTSPDVGSVLIYRADNSQLESLGSRTIIDTIAAKNGSGTWVISYTDTTGTNDSLYRIQFWDGIGSTAFSDVIGEQFDELLCNFDDVRRLANLQNKDVGSEEIYYAIKDATEDVFFSAGDPIKQSVIYVDSLTGTAGEVYNFNGDWGPIYQVREVYIDDGATSFIVKSTDYDIDYANGEVKFTDAFIGSYQGKNVYINWVPTTYHILVKYVAALDLIEGQNIFVGRDVIPPYVNKLKGKIDELKEAIRPKGLYSTKSENILSDYDVVAQHSDRTFLYFNH